MVKNVQGAGSVQDQITAAFLSVLNREPNTKELRIIKDSVKGSGDELYKDLVWVLINSHEFFSFSRSTTLTLTILTIQKNRELLVANFEKSDELGRREFIAHAAKHVWVLDLCRWQGLTFTIVSRLTLGSSESLAMLSTQYKRCDVALDMAPNPITLIFRSC